ncbi:lipid II flippase MurJ [Dyella agri]|uniref:lipid II flippase MurJ n=1 Tax=Dyella agri TaxID=1926869 RepID=UPI00384A60B2
MGVVLVPLYLKYMGAEAYGLVGFYAMLQRWFNVLDMGLTPTMAHQTARFHGGGLSALDYRRLVRTLEGIFFAVALFGGGLLFLSAHWVGGHWLKVRSLPLSEVALCLQMIAIIVALRWMGGLYRGAVTGAERQVWLSVFTSLVATLRFVAVVPVLVYVSAAPTVFFGFQLGTAVFETVGLMWMTGRLLPQVTHSQKLTWDWTPLKPVLGFALTIAFTSTVWVFVTQSDQLVLSKLLPLADYGYFTAAILVASGLMIVSGPVSNAIMPRMTNLEARGDHTQLIAIYRQATQLIVVTAIPATLVLTFFPRQVLWAWTGDTVLVDKVASVLRLYALGYGILTVGAFPYYLQYAKSNLRLHLVGNIFFAVLLIPSIVWSAIHYGMIGTGWAWLASNIIYFLLWTPLVHRRFAPGLHWDWTWRDVARPSAPALLVAAVAAWLVAWSPNRTWLAIELAIAGVVFMALTYWPADRLAFFHRLDTLRRAKRDVA